MPKRRKRYLFVSRELGGGQAGAILASAARKSADVVVIAEGPACTAYEDAGFRLYFKGTPRPEEVTFALNAGAALESIRPDAVIATAGSPSYLEPAFGLAANKLGVPLVILEDWFVNHRCTPARPDLLLTSAPIASAIARSDYPDERVRIVTVGNHTVSAALTGRVPAALRRDIQNFRSVYGGILCFAGGGEETEDTLELLIACLEKTTTPWALIPAFHPNFINLPHPSGGTFGQQWSKLLKPLGARVQKPSKGYNLLMAKGADVTISNGSSLLNAAVACGKRGIMLATPQQVERFARERSLPHHPLVLGNLIPEVTTPQDLTPLFRAAKPNRAAVRTVLAPFQPRRALRAIKELVP